MLPKGLQRTWWLCRHLNCLRTMSLCVDTCWSRRLLQASSKELTKVQKFNLLNEHEDKAVKSGSRVDMIWKERCRQFHRSKLWPFRLQACPSRQSCRWRWSARRSPDDQAWGNHSLGHFWPKEPHLEVSLHGGTKIAGWFGMEHPHKVI